MSDVTQKDNDTGDDGRFVRIGGFLMGFIKVLISAETTKLLDTICK